MPSIPNRYLRSLDEALLDAFPTRAKLARMLRYELEKVLDTLVPPDTNIRDTISELLDVSQREGWTTDLIEGARRDAPGNEKLKIFAEKLEQDVKTSNPPKTHPTTPPPTPDVELNISPEKLEAVIKKAYGFLDVEWWAAQFGTIKQQVCRITFPGNSPEGRVGFSGTGFLVGPDMILTNYHVVEPLVYGEQGQLTPTGRSARVKDVKLTFDYKLLADRQTINPGEDVSLSSSDWLIDHGLKLGLDYALLRLAQPVGNKRGWIALSSPPLLEAGMPLFIVQHPNGRPLQLALDTVIDWKEQPDRVRYTTNTEAGSSGSPCFTAKWELAALHYASDGDEPPTYNQGIPITAIVQRWKQEGLWASHFQQLPTPPVQVERLATPVSASQTSNSTSGQPASETPTVDLQALIAGLDRHKLLNILLRLNDTEFRMLLAILGKIEYDHLGGDNTGRKTLELVLWAERHNHFADLIRVAHNLYPNLGWKV